MYMNNSDIPEMVKVSLEKLPLRNYFTDDFVVFLSGFFDLLFYLIIILATALPDLIM